MLNHKFFSTEQFQHSLDVTFIENALIDLLVRATDQELEHFGMKKGVMQLVESHIQQEILAKLGHKHPEIELGGSAANAARALAILGGKTCYSSCIGEDENGKAFATRLKNLDIHNRLVYSSSLTTGSCVIIVTPDSERTLNTYLGACTAYTPFDVPFEEIKNSKIFFSTGYMLDTQNQIEALHAAFDQARNHNVKVAFDVADPFVIQRHGSQHILELLTKTHLVFANAAESQMLVGMTGAKAAQKLGEFIELVVVKDGEGGAYFCFEEKVTHIPALSVKVTDTTGAGDMFAAGFLFGLCSGLPFPVCGRVASILAADTITHLGAKLSIDIKSKVEDLIKNGTMELHL